ncbi:MAG: phosphatase PAP2 family protein [Planctomycetes bacterium]|nr:phosphatase PAP2 family protein [Planctomycetota bacterium]
MTGAAPDELPPASAPASAEPRGEAADLKPGPTGTLPSDGREKFVLVSLLFLWTFGGYYLIGLNYDPGQAASLATAWDDAIPFLPIFMWAYEGVYTVILFPVFVVRCQRLFRRVIWGYFWVATVSLVIWALFPVAAIELRPDVTKLDPSVFHHWGVRVNYALDPPLNLFPSLHVAIATLVVVCAYKARPAYGALAGSGAVLIALSTVFVKQHFVVDVVGGVVLAGVVSWFTLADYDPGEEASVADVAYSWKGVLGYGAFHLTLVVGFLALFLLDWRPFE